MADERKMTVSHHLDSKNLRCSKKPSDDDELDSCLSVGGADTSLYDKPLADVRIDHEQSLVSFRQLRDKWKQDTQFSSSATQVINHPAYKLIISLGKPMLPFILDDLRQDANHWFYAAGQIVGYIPDEEDQGNVGTMRSAWLRWADDNKSYIAHLRNARE